MVEGTKRRKTRLVLVVEDDRPIGELLAAIINDEDGYLAVHLTRPTQALEAIKEDEFFGEIGLLRGEPRNATVRARTSLEVIQVSKEAFELLVKSSEQTAEEIARVAQRRTRASREAAPSR